MSHLSDKILSDKFRELERSFDSDPYDIYVNEDEHNKINYKAALSSTIESKKSKGSVNRQTVISSNSDMTVSKSSTHNSSEIINNFMDGDLEFMREIILEEANAEIEAASIKISSSDNSTDWNSFFNCFDIENSINNVIACEDNETVIIGSVHDKNISDVSSSYIFEKSPDILPDQGYDPFIQYDRIGYEDDKNKHKQQKNINRLGMIALSTAVVMGSAWINSLFRN
jgi:hypothetical protein